MSRWYVSMFTATLVLMASCMLVFGDQLDHAQSAEIQEGIQPANLILITLDTTRADCIGAYGSETKVTPNIDRLADSGILYTRAITPSPLTLPAHATLLTGLDPPEHGIRDNGRARLAANIPTLATVLKAHGFSTAAFVSSRVLDRRFGLNRGFSVYDDRMAAEIIGEYGYAERDAERVTDRALDWLSHIKRDQPFFLWVHYYDPHSPYNPPGRWRRGNNRDNYLGEIGFMDHHIARLLEALSRSDQRRILAIVGDHGESLGEHGERTHGVFLYNSVLAVPLIITGDGVAAGLRVKDVVSTRQLAGTLLHLVGFGPELDGLGDTLPGLPALPSSGAENWVYSETEMPANAYGWSPLKALTGNRWRLIVAPRPELYDLKNDRSELKNLIDEKPEVAQQLRSVLARYEKQMGVRQAVPFRLDSEIGRALESLGYVDGARTDSNDGIDPKDGLSLLDSLGRAKLLMQRGAFPAALEILTRIKAINPHNLPILTHLARAQLEIGDAAQAVATYRDARALNPESEFLAINLARALDRSGQNEEAKLAYRQVLAIDSRSASAWLSLASLAETETEKLRILQEALNADVDSTIVYTQLAELEHEAGNLDDAELLLGKACDLTPELSGLWLIRGQVAEGRGHPLEARARYQRALLLEPEDPAIMLRLARIQLELNDFDDARRLLRRIVKAEPGSASARAARTLLGGMGEGATRE